MQQHVPREGLLCRYRNPSAMSIAPCTAFVCDQRVNAWLRAAGLVQLEMPQTKDSYNELFVRPHLAHVRVAQNASVRAAAADVGAGLLPLLKAWPMSRHWQK